MRKNVERSQITIYEINTESNSISSNLANHVISHLINNSNPNERPMRKREQRWYLKRKSVVENIQKMHYKSRKNTETCK